MSRRVALSITRAPGLLLLLTGALLLPLVAGAQNSQTQAVLENKLSQQYGAIQRQFRDLPPPAADVAARRHNLRLWQGELARLFSEAAVTVEEILKLNPPNADLWRTSGDFASIRTTNKLTRTKKHLRREGSR